MGIPISNRASIVGIETIFEVRNVGQAVFLPQSVALIGQGNTASTYPLTKLRITSSGQASSVFGYGSPLHLASKELFPDNGDGIKSIPVYVYPLEDAGSGVAATGDITAAGAQTEDQIYQIKVNEIPTSEFQIASGTTASAAITQIKDQLDAVLDMPLTTGANTGVELILDLTSKWKGESANNIFVEIVGEEAGIVFTVTQLNSGAVNPDIDDALNKIGSEWRTIICNLLNYDDTATLDKISVYGEGRWGEEVKQPLFSIVGTVDDLATRTAITDARKTDRVNVIIPAPGSNELPSNIAARAVSRIALTANDNPPWDHKTPLTGIVPGGEEDQETYTERDTSIKAGSSTTILRDGVLYLEDVVTMYHPTGETIPAYGKLSNIVRLQNIIFNLRLIFEADDWRGAPLLPDDTPRSSTSGAKSPKDARTLMGILADSLAFVAIIADPAYTRDNNTASISGQNNDRLDLVFPVTLSGNTNIINITTSFGFFFGS